MTTAKETPLGINVHSSFLQNCGLTINPDAAAHMGVSCDNDTYSFGSAVSSTCLNLLTWAINDAYNRGVVSKTTAGSSVYDNLISIGSGVCEALGNSKPPTYNGLDPSDAQIPSDTPTWYHEGTPATTGFSISGDTGQGQSASWLPYDMTNPNHSVTQWGFIRTWALQANNEFNWNGGTGNVADPCSPVQYKDFLNSFETCASFADYTNISACLIENAPDYLKGVYSNMNDLTSADFAGVSLSDCFGIDCITAGKVIDLSKIDRFGLPSVLLQTISKNHAKTQALNLALLSSGLSPDEVNDISTESASFITRQQEQQIYGAFLVIVGTDLQDILVPLNCKTEGLETLADLLNVRKLFPCSYKSITVPIYNTAPGPTNSKTYYPVFENEGVSPRLDNPVIVEQVGTIVPPGEPPIVPKETPPVTIEAVPVVVAPTSPVVVPPPSVEEAPAPVAPPSPPKGGGGCPAPWINITLSDGITIKAGNVKPGMLVYTKHETQDVWGDYLVTASEIVTDERWIVKFENDIEFVGTFNHRVLTDSAWTEIRDLTPGSKVMQRDGYAIVKEVAFLDHGEVVKITVQDAHTYLAEGLVSHNVKAIIYGGGCVALESYVPRAEEKLYNTHVVRQAYQLIKGHQIYLADEKSLETNIGTVVEALNELQPCVRIVTEDGTSLVCSTTAPIPTFEDGVLHAPLILGKSVGVNRNNITYWNKVVSITDVGQKFVRAIDTGNNSFWAGEVDGAYILHHNTPVTDDAGTQINKN